MGLFRDDSSSLHQPIPRPILIAIGSVALVLATFGWKFIAEGRESNRIKEGRLVILELYSFVDENNGRWPSKWSDLAHDRSEEIDLDFSLKIEDFAKNPDRIYTAVRLKKHPKLQHRLKPDLDELRQLLLKQSFKAQP